MSALPSSTASRPRITRIVVDLPAPFGPTNPVTLPGATANDRPSRATVSPNRFRTRLTSIVASMPGKLGGERRLVVAPASHLSIAGLSYEGRTASLSGGMVGSLRRAMPNGRPAGTMIHVVGVENWRRGRPDHQAWITPGATAPLLAYGSLGVLAVGESILRSALEGVSAQRALGLCVVALATTLPPAFVGATAAAIAVVAASVVSLTLFHALTVAALVAQMAALYSLTRAGEPRSRAQLIAISLSAAFVVLALVQPVPSASAAGVLTLLLAALAPASAFARIA